MARGRTPAELWIGTPDEVDFCPPIYPVRCIYFLWEEGASESIFFFCYCGMGQNQRSPLWSLSF
jgi:hypothetical protein